MLLYWWLGLVLRFCLVLRSDSNHLSTMIVLWCCWYCWYDLLRDRWHHGSRGRGRISAVLLSLVPSYHCIKIKVKIGSGDWCWFAAVLIVVHVSRNECSCVNCLLMFSVALSSQEVVVIISEYDSAVMLLVLMFLKWCWVINSITVTGHEGMYPLFCYPSSPFIIASEIKVKWGNNFVLLLSIYYYYLYCCCWK
jgi:hypothetical protein